jgi:multidrug efflux pump subunit AcrA (membrane-fusion protein)
MPLSFPDKLRLEVNMKTQKRFIFWIQIGVCLGIAAVLLRVGSSLFDKVPPAAQAASEPNVTTVQPEKAGPVHRVAQGMVSVVHPEKSEGATLQLPGQLSAYTDAPIYAQTSGYLKSWSFDIGAKVKANDILGDIDTPEVDQALAQAIDPCRRHKLRSRCYLCGCPDGNNKEISPILACQGRPLEYQPLR